MMRWMASSGRFCGIVRRKEVSFVVLLVQSGRVSRVSNVKGEIRVSVRIRVSLVLVIWWG